MTGAPRPGVTLLLERLAPATDWGDLIAQVYRKHDKDLSSRSRISSPLELENRSGPSDDAPLRFEFHQERGERLAERLDARLLLGVDE
jgi:hypothetical protein